MESEGTFMQLLGPGEDSPALLRRAMDALRREWILEPGLEQPLGAYLKGEELEFHDPSNTFDDSRIHSDSDGGSDDPSGTDSAWSDYMSSDTEATSYDSDGLINKEASDSFDVSSYEGGPPIAAYNGTMTQAAMIKELFNIARAGYPSEYTCSLMLRNTVRCRLTITYCFAEEFYALQMAVTQHKSTFVNGVDDTVFHLELDTGSNTTRRRDRCPCLSFGQARSRRANGV
ncbi:hypothetical protein C8Q70DRAFT_72054 [Cubamyces menziesii]|nr:hypothetical protein C8Q70DRAFT_72054 [Cubamyces menziesii]